jgi:hypothetical protein
MNPNSRLGLQRFHANDLYESGQGDACRVITKNHFRIEQMDAVFLAIA